MAKSKTYELMLQIAGKADSSLKAACREASGNLDALAETAKTVGKVSAAALSAAATAVASAATASITAYAQHETAANKMAAVTGAAGAELEHLNDVMEEVYTNNFGEDIQDVADTVGLVNRNLKDLPTDQLTDATEAAISLRDAFGYTAEETTRAAAAIKKNFGGETTKAFSLIAAGAQNGLDYSGEMIDTINEYSSQFSKLGFTADGMFGLLQSGADSTAWNLDKVGDAIKEFSIRSIDGSDSTKEAFESLGYNSKQMMSTFAAGGEEANKAFFDVLNTLMDVENEVKRDALGVSLFGTMWEDLGTEAMEAMANASTAAYDTGNALEQINTVQYGGLESSLQGIQRQAESILVTIGQQLAPYAAEGMEYLAENVIPAVSEGLAEFIPQVMEMAGAVWENREVIIDIATAVGAAVATFKGLKAASTVVSTVKTLGAVFSAGAKNGSMLSSAVNLLGGKFTIIAAIIAAVVAACVLIYKNWDKIQAWAVRMGDKVEAVWANISGAVQNFIASVGEKFPVLGAYMEGWWQSVSAAWENVKAIFSGIISFVDNVFSGNWSAAWDNIVAIFGNVFGMIGNLAKAPINGVISVINWVLGKINSISVTIPDWVPGLGGQTLGFSIPTIPALAVGGIATAPTLAMIGEGSEPEAVLPLSKLADLLNREPDNPKGGGNGFGGGEQIVFSPIFNFYGSVTKEEAEEAGRLSFAEFKRLYEQMEAEKRRKKL